jgi:hypothetical protein
VRVHPATGWKSVFVNPGFTRRIVGVPKAESDAILTFLFRQISDNPDFQVRFRWEENSIALWDNRVSFLSIGTAVLWAFVGSSIYCTGCNTLCDVRFLACDATCAQGDAACGEAFECGGV